MPTLFQALYAQRALRLTGKMANGVCCMDRASRARRITGRHHHGECPTVAKHEVFHDFVDALKRLGYTVWFDVVDSSKYGVPQMRRRMVLFASKHGEIKMIPPTHERQNRSTGYRPLEGTRSPARWHQETVFMRRLLYHPRTSQRIRASRPGGTWRDQPCSTW